jgi:hypothetical protein
MTCHKYSLVVLNNKFSHNKNNNNNFNIIELNSLLLMSWHNSCVTLITGQHRNKRKIHKQQRQTHRKEISTITPKNTTKIL